MAIHTRREFLIASALTVGSFVVSTGLGGCGDSSASSDNNTATGTFEHGVASGDPLHDRVILWTRITPLEDVASLSVSYEVATDEAFKNLVRPAEQATVSRSGDYTLKVDFQNLQAGTQYYYRFRIGNTTSPVGKTKTLPSVTSEVKLAVFSCANYPKGFFNAYSAAAALEGLDATLHLGDYIYEYGMFEADGVTPAYATENAAAIGRVIPQDNDTELYSLEDYRKRYALYHTDSGLQAIHAAAPMIAVWDDHEIANDTYKDGAQNHDAAEGDFSQRKRDALQAYFEWMPIRPATADDHETIYRSFAFGDLVALHMLDTRIIGRDKQLSYNDYPELFFSGDASNFTADLTSPTRTMLGTQQLQWLQTQMASSNATWQVLGQQVLMARMQLPAEVLMLIAQLEGATGEAQITLLTQLSTTLMELAQIKQRMLMVDSTVSEAEAARVNTVLPYNLDAWDGYFMERESILGTAVAYDKNLVVLSGDTHNGWASDLKTISGESAGVEFAASSVSSPGMEEYAMLTSDAAAQQFEQVISLLIDTLQYFNANNRGFLHVSFTQEEAVARWHYVDNIDSTQYELLTSRAMTLKTTTAQRSIQSV